MSFQATHSPAPAEKAHDHFYHSIAGFPQLQSGPSFDHKADYVRESIKHQLLTVQPNSAARYVNLRNCFKLQQRKYVDFCLQHKVPGVTVEQAAMELGLRK